MTIPDDLSERELYLAELGTSDEGVEALLSAGNDIDALIAAGVLEVDEPTADEEEDEAIELEPSTLTEDEARAWFIAKGYDYRPVPM